MKQYKPKKKRYNDLSSLHREMKDMKVKIESFDGSRIVTNKATYTLCDSTIFIKVNDGNN